MAISRWEPFSEMMPLRDMMNRLLEESFIMPRTYTRPGEMATAFPMDVYETENDVVVKAEMPGMRPEDIDVRITDNVLTITGEHREEHEYGTPPSSTKGQAATAGTTQTTGSGAGAQAGGMQQGRAMAREEAPTQTWYRREIRRGMYHREVALPTMVQADKAEATFENGLLTLTIPKAEEAKPRRIQVRGRAGQSGQPRLETGR